MYKESLVSANDNGSGEKLTSLVMQPNQTAAIVRPSVDTSQLSIIRSALAELNVTELIINAGIAVQLRKGTKNLFIINENYSTTNIYL